MRMMLAALVLCTVAPAMAGEVSFSSKPTAAKDGEKVKVTFSVSAPADVEVTVLDKDGKAVRHLAAGVLGAEKAPPAPLKAGLAQELVWDGKDDFGRALPSVASGEGGFKVRVRAGTGVKLGGFIGADPYNLGAVASSAADDDGNVYVMGFGGQLNQAQMNLRVFDKDGRYLREILPFPANLPDDGALGVAKWDDEKKSWTPRQRNNLNPDFYFGQKGALAITSISKEHGIVLKDPRGVGAGTRYVVIDAAGAVQGFRPVAGAPAARPASPEALAAIKAKAPKRESLPGDWARLVVDTERDQVYVNDGCSQFWRFDGKTGEGGQLRKDGRVFGATDLSFGHDGLIYARTGRGAADGCDYSGPLARFTRELAPAPYASGTHVLSPYIYSRYGIGYAERGIGVGPDGKVYISFMHDWVKYCIAGFDAEGKPMKGRFMEGKVGNKGNAKAGYPAELTSAIIGPIPQGNGGIRVDLAGDIYVGMLFLPKGFTVPAGQDKMVWSFMVGGVCKFAPEGGCVKGEDGMMRGSEAEGLLAFYPGLGPFSSAGFTCNPCCACRGPRWDLDRWGRLVMPNGVSNSVRLVDNAGNLIVEFGKYGNFDSQFVNENTEAGKQGKPTVSVPDIPLAWPTGAGFGRDALYVLDTYSRRVVRTEMTFRAEETCEAK